MELRINRVVQLSILLLLPCFLSSCFVTRSVFWYPTGVNDYQHFCADTMHNHEPVSEFKASRDSLRLLIPEKYLKTGIYGSFDDLLKNSHTLAFLVIRNDSLLFSRFFNGYNDASMFPSFSIAKSFVSALVGIAIEEGYIRELDQPVTDFFPELTKKGYSKVTLRHLITMRSGIDFNEGYNDPFGDASRIYYGRNIKKFILSLPVISEPGKVYSYQSGNTQLLTMVVEKATGKSISEYLEEKIWKPLGMKNLATWSLDSKKNHEVKSFCCINASASDFARFGQLFLDGGVSGEKQLIPASWIKESLTIQNDSKDSRGYPYTYYWRVRENGEFFAYGVLGQYIYVSPEKNVVLVRLGEKAGSIDWPKFFHLMMDQL